VVLKKTEISIFREKHGADAVFQLLSGRDNDGWGCLEWAVESGEVNTVEYLIRKGLNPFKVVPSTGQTLLHIAISRHRLDVAIFLLDLGCDPHLKDNSGVSSANHHALGQDRAMRWELNQHPSLSHFRSFYGFPRKTIADLESGIEIPPTWDILNGQKKSFAIKRLCPTRLSYLLAYALVTLGCWVLSAVIPFYGWVPLIGAIGGAYRYHPYSYYLYPFTLFSCISRKATFPCKLALFSLGQCMLGADCS
jgi:hypothetical protein